MRFVETPLKGLFVIEADPFRDARGVFARVFCENELRSIGHTKKIVQVNNSVTCAQGALRGMHYQRPPFDEIKIVKCLKGRVFDVAVDMRAGSATFLNWYGVELSEDRMNSLYIPEGFAHGFQTLEENCSLIYLSTGFYSAAHECGVRFDDPRVRIKWPLPVGEVSKKDGAVPCITDDFKGVVI